jgi:NAD(P)-dependent dehydrogenase (short-subunit alcohol dehydrogenase family)
VTGGDFSGKPGATVVTGGTGGLGEACCRMLAQRGSAVAFTYNKNVAKAGELVAELSALASGRAKAWPVDLVDEAATAAFLDEVVAELGGIHTLVHAAGPHIPQLHLSRVEPAQYRDQLNAEAAAFYNVVHHALPRLRESQGSIVAVTTAATRRFPVRDGLSSGTKASIEAVVRAIAAEEGRFGIRANCVGPGMMTDGMAQRLMASGDLDDAALEITRRNIPLRRFGDAVDIAEAVCFLASDRADFISGQMLDVDGGYGV